MRRSIVDRYSGSRDSILEFEPAVSVEVRIYGQGQIERDMVKMKIQNQTATNQWRDGQI